MKIAVEKNEKMNSGQICDEQTKLIDTMLFVFYRPRERERERERILNHTKIVFEHKHFVFFDLYTYANRWNGITSFEWLMK